MTKPKIQIGDEVREMTDSEFAQWQKDVAELNANAEAVANAIEARKTALAKLKALGLTTAEIDALVGQ